MHSIQCWEGNARLQQRQPLMSASTFVLLIPPSTVSLSCRCASTTVWCSDSSDTQECWRPSASDSRDTASNTRSRYFLVFSSCLLSNCLWTLWPVGTWETFPDLICNVSGLCASLPCAAASRHEPNQVCYQGLLQKSAPATCWISSGQHHGVCVCVFSWIRPVLKFRSGCWKMLLFVEGVSAGGGASAASDAPPSGGPATDRHTAASLQGHAGEKALCQHETICFYHSGGMFWLEDGEARFEEVLLWLLLFLMVVILPVIFSETTFKPSSSFCS